MMAHLHIGSEPNLDLWRSDTGQWAEIVASISYPCGTATIWSPGVGQFRYQLHDPTGRVYHVSAKAINDLEQATHRAVRALETVRLRDDFAIPWHDDYRPHVEAPRSLSVWERIVESAETIKTVVLLILGLVVSLAYVYLGGSQS